MQIYITGVVFAACCLAQGQVAEPPAGTGIPHRRDGKIEVQLHLSAQPASLDELIEAAERGLIIDGFVSTVLPSFNRNPALPEAIETDSVVTTSSIFHGVVPGGVSKILITQEGGRVGSTEEVVAQDPVVKAGDRYIWFLAPDIRKLPANLSGLPRYYLAGVWSGKVMVNGGIFHTMPNAEAFLHQYDNTEVGVFVQQLKKRIGILLRNERPQMRIGLVVLATGRRVLLGHGNVGLGWTGAGIARLGFHFQEPIIQLCPVGRRSPLPVHR